MLRLVYWQIQVVITVSKKCVSSVLTGEALLFFVKRSGLKSVIVLLCCKDDLTQKSIRHTVVEILTHVMQYPLRNSCADGS